MPSVKNFQPKTGVGRFDVDITGTKLTVTVKLHLVSALAGEDLKRFVDGFEPVVREHWEKKYGFVNGPTKLFPTFSIEYVDDMIDAHFVINLLAGEGGSELVSRDVYYKVKDRSGFAPTSANLFTGSIAPTDSSGDLVRDLRNSFPYYIDTPGGVISPHASEQLGMLINQLKRADPNANVEVTAYGSNKVANRAAMITLLQTLGMANVVKRTSNKVFASKNPRTGSKDYVKIGMAAGLGMIDVSSEPLFTYPAAAVHEFGHMLGLQDEYACLSKKAADKMAELAFIDASERSFFEGFHPTSGTPPSVKVENGQVEFVKYCKEAGVAVPHFGQHTISIMSSGSAFMPYHFVTIWAAVKQASPGNWAIVKFDA